MNRRGFLTLGATFLAAPAILRVTTLDVLPQYETVEVFVWYYEERGGLGPNKWHIAGSTLAEDYAGAAKAFAKTRAVFQSDNMNYHSLHRRDDTRRLITRRRERIIV